MSFMSDLFEGNFGNLGHDLTSHFKEDLPYWGAAVGTALTAGALGPELFGAAAGAGAAEGAAGSALGFAGEAGAAEGAGGLSGFLADPAAAGLSGGSGSGAVTDALGWSSIAGDPGLGGGVIGPSLPSDPGLGGGIIGPEWTGGGPGGGTSFGAQAGGAAGTSGGSSGGGFIDSLVSGAKSSLTKNPLGIGAAAVGLGMNMLKGNPTDPNQAKLQQQADQLGAQGQMLQQYLANGTLPPGMQAQLTQATQAAKARIIANHAKNGMSTDPSQNSALAQELNAVDTNAVAAMADAQINMMKTGLTETGLSSQLYEMLTKMDRQNNQDLMSAIAAFAAQLGGGGNKNVTLSLGKAA